MIIIHYPINRYWDYGTVMKSRKIQAREIQIRMHPRSTYGVGPHFHVHDVHLQFHDTCNFKITLNAPQVSAIGEGEIAAKLLGFRHKSMIPFLALLCAQLELSGS